ncbi:MAG: hypothetical protein HFH62_10080 [Lachnospiraceae bacterium]|nr:hypothetical protein [Lachnospiraceae bacterium]
MENTILILLFIGGLLIFLGTMGVDVVKLILNFIFRSLLGIVLIGLANYFIEKAGGNLFVNINEISVLLSGVLGVWGVILVYIIRYYFTI